VRRLLPLGIIGVVIGISASPAAAMQVTHERFEATGSGRILAGGYCDFTLRETDTAQISRTIFSRDGHVVKIVDHQVWSTISTNARTGTFVTEVNREEGFFRGYGAPFRLTGAFAQVWSQDGALLWSSAGLVSITDIHDHYEFLRSTGHVTAIPGFTAVPGLCEMLGGNQVV